jgi:hypothetical protein
MLVDQIIATSDPLEVTKSLVFISTDGGPEHKNTNPAVQEATVAAFLHSKLDGIWCARSCPYNSWTQPVERTMSWLNFALLTLEAQ